MMNPLFFLCGQESIPVQTDLVYDMKDDQVMMRFIGIRNLLVSEHYCVLQFPTQLESNAKILGDGFQMLAQTAGQLDAPIEIGRCPDNSSSYRLYSEKAHKRFYNYLAIEESDGFTLFGFTSCYRFSGYFELHKNQGTTTVAAFLNGEDTHPQDWASNQMEAITVIKADSLTELYELYAAKVQQQHPIRPGVKQNAPIGWCSWYAYYADVTEKNVLDNVEVMCNDHKELEWVLLDDGYQAFMGDWLTPSEKFPNGIQALLKEIKARGKKPAIWIAPFIAQPESEIFKTHPEWFVRHKNGDLLKAEDITYGGWRCTPWYILDTSKQAVQIHLTDVIRTMREEWGVELFKLDANYWGSLKGQRIQSGITGIEAYRLGMQAIINGAGDALILGCNAPMWPSLGLVDAMRISDDVERNPERFKQIAKETFYRSWQHRKLWQIDPDCITLTSLPNQGTERKYYEFHRTVILASGGLALSGDPLPEMNIFAKKTWKNLLSRLRLTQESAQFQSLSNRHCVLRLNHQHELHCIFNYDDEIAEFTLNTDQLSIWRDFWTGEQLNEEPMQVLQLTLEPGLSSRAILVSI